MRCWPSTTFRPSIGRICARSTSSKARSRRCAIEPCAPRDASPTGPRWRWSSSSPRPPRKGGVGSMATTSRPKSSWEKSSPTESRSSDRKFKPPPETFRHKDLAIALQNLQPCVFGPEMTVILFDIDGTLLDHDGAERASARALHQATGTTLPVEEFLSRWSAALEREFARYLKGEITYQAQGRARVRAVIDPALTDDAADRIYAQYIAGYEDAWSLFPGAIPCLDILSQHRLGIISNGLISEQRKKLVKTGIDGRFEFILISEACGWAKPSSEIFHHACAAMGGNPACGTNVGNLRSRCLCSATRRTNRRLARSMRPCDREALTSDHHEAGSTPGAFEIMSIGRLTSARWSTTGHRGTRHCACRY